MDSVVQRVRGLVDRALGGLRIWGVEVLGFMLNCFCGV